MGAAFKDQLALAVRDQQRRQHCLQHQGGASRRPNGERVDARLNAAGCERQLARADGRTRDLGSRDLSRSVHRGEVLSQESGILAPRPNALDAKRLARHQGERQRRAQNLPASFSE